jgi:murein L,D-transpeptidase YafK
MPRTSLLPKVPLALIILVVANPVFADVGPHAGIRAELVVVRKAERTLELRSGGDVLHEFRIALGRNLKGHKRQQGDSRTPEGVYVLDGRNTASRFYRSIRISYPEPRDYEGAQRWGVSPGGDIMIHGLPNGVAAERVGHPEVDWTNGCVAVTNDEIDEIWADVEDGTTIIIFP